MPLSPAPSGGEIEACPAREVSEAGRFITKSRRWWQKAAFPGTCQSTKHLTELQRLIRQHNEGERQVPLREPDLLIILTGGRMAYTRPDGVKVIPLGCLKN